MRRSTIGDHSFAVASQQAWNNLPVDLCISLTFTTFKTHLKSHLFNLSFPSVWLYHWLFLYRALKAGCAAYASLNLSLLHYNTYGRLMLINEVQSWLLLLLLFVGKCVKQLQNTLPAQHDSLLDETAGWGRYLWNQPQSCRIDRLKWAKGSKTNSLSLLKWPSHWLVPSQVAVVMLNAKSGSLQKKLNSLTNDDAGDNALNWNTETSAF